MNNLRFRRDGTPVNRAQGERSNFYRNRKVAFSPDEVVTDGKGNILQRPIVKRPPLPCFGDPVEYFRGLFDRPIQYPERQPQAKFCALCPVQAARCDRVAFERIESDPQLKHLHSAWEQATQGLAGIDRFTHVSWGEFVRACDVRSWADSHDEALEQERWDAIDKRMRASARKRREVKPRPRPLSKSMQTMLDQERVRRTAELLMLRSQPGAPLWLRNRTEERTILVADAWWAQACLDESRQKSSGSAVLAHLINVGAVKAPVARNFVKVIEKALKAANGHWTEPFPPILTPLPSFGQGVHPNAVIMVLDED